MNFQPPSLLSTSLFVALLVGVQGVLVIAARRAGPKEGRVARTSIALGVIAGVALMSAALATWVLSPSEFLPTALTLVTLNVSALGLAFRPIGLAMGQALPMGHWVLLHVFRLPLEALLAGWHNAGTVPVQLTWSGQNFDVVTGVLGLFVGLFLIRRPHKGLAITFHIVGLGLLLNVARIAVLSAPGAPFQTFEEPVLLPFHVPFIWIVPFAVVAALFAHVVALRALLSQPIGEK